MIEILRRNFDVDKVFDIIELREERPSQHLMT